MREPAHYFDFSAESVEGFSRKKWTLAAALWASAYGLAIVRSLARFLFQACAPSGGRRLCFSKPRPETRDTRTCEREHAANTTALDAKSPVPSAHLERSVATASCGSESAPAVPLFVLLRRTTRSRY